MSAAEPQFHIPAKLADTVARWEGDAGRAWLERLPGLVGKYLDRWGLRQERVVEPGGQISLVLYVRQSDGAPAVLKAGLPHSETVREPEALAHWNGRGSVALLDAAPEDFVLLLERLNGEVPLRSLPEDKAMLEALGTLRRLWVEPPTGHQFTLVRDRVAELAGLLRARRTLAAEADALPLLDEALDLSAALLADEPELLLLHGDFHHGNVLAGERQPWLAIDPKPLVGERAYDLAWLAQDRLETLAGSPGPAAAARRRLNRLADLVEVDRERLRGWTLFRAVEAGLWSLSVGDRGAAELFLEFAGQL